MLVKFYQGVCLSALLVFNSSYIQAQPLSAKGIVQEDRRV